MNSKITMREILAALTMELGEEEGKRVFSWYCTTYGVSVTDEAPDTVVREVLGTDKGEGVVNVEHLEGDTIRATDEATGICITFTAGYYEETQKGGNSPAWCKKIIEGEISPEEAAGETAAAARRIADYLAKHRPELL